MQKQVTSKTEISLASGLIGKDSDAIHGQLEIKYKNYNTVRIALWRKLHSGLPDVVFEIEDTELPEILELLTEANDKITAHWLSKISLKQAEK